MLDRSSWWTLAWYIRGNNGFKTAVPEATGDRCFDIGAILGVLPINIMKLK